jgi:hypothetical protein
MIITTNLTLHNRPINFAAERETCKLMQVSVAALELLIS